MSVLTLHTVALLVAMFAPAAASLWIGLVFFVRGRVPSEDAAAGAVRTALVLSLLAGVLTAATAWGALGVAPHEEVDLGAWLRVGTYQVPAVLLVDDIALSFSLLAAALTALIARFSRTYLHREPGFVRFHVLLGLFATGTQLIAYAGALDVAFAGWELMGISSALFIGFFFERREPVRSGVRAFAIYRLCDAGFLLGIVATHELLGSTRLSALERAPSLSPVAASVIGALFLVSAIGKSALLPFSGWIVRAMEGPTPSSALFYGGVSIHAGMYLLLRVWPVLDVAPAVAAVGVAVGLCTAVYAGVVARTHTDAKGALAHATLSQVGLILAEISAGLIDLALVHLLGHAFLRVWQYLRAPNAVHDAHRLGHAPHAPSWWSRRVPGLARRVYAAALHRFRLDDGLDLVLAPLFVVVRALERVDARVRAAVSLDGPRDRDGGAR